MTSQSSFEESRSPSEIPSTPIPLDIDLPTSQNNARASPPTSTAVGLALSSSNTDADLAHPSKSDAKYSSAISSSMTPPPSTQMSASRQPARADTPTTSMLSSPPPTVTNGASRNSGTGSGSSRPSLQHIDSASSEELRDMVLTLLANEAKHDAVLAESRMTIAHLNLQMNMLSAEKESELQRMEVEHNMTKREVNMLSMARSDVNTPGSSLLTNYIKLDEKHQALGEFAEALRRRLERAKKVIESKDDEILDLKEDIIMYRKRIQEKHNLYNTLRSPGGPFHSSNLKTPTGSHPNSPQQYRGTPKRTPMTGRSVGREEPFAALLLADRVLSQENNSAPSTPVVARRPDPRTPIRHNRGAQSLSSLQTTPGSARPVLSNTALLPSVQFNPQPSRERRRKSRDSTISAPDAEEIARAAMATFNDDSEEEVNESQASQTATEMLRADPRESFEVAASRNGTPVPVEKIQSKLMNTVTKNAMEKRKYIDDGGDHLAKKARLVGDVGLGIGFSSPRV